jgi:uncharacterized protein YjbI with pentapeptide repeats
MQWVGLIAVSLPGLAALGALLFTCNLGSQSLDIRLGGIYALQRIMQDSARDHPTVVSVLAAFTPWHAGSSADSLKEPLDPEATPTSEADVRAEIATLAHRRLDHDRGTVIDLSKSDLRGLRFTERALATLHNANLEGAHLERANLRVAKMIGASLPSSFLPGADLRRADMTCAEELRTPETGEVVQRTN